MNNTHLSGGSIAALVSFASARYGWNLSDGEATILGGAAFAAGAGFVHLLVLAYRGPGIVGAVKRTLLGG